MLTREKKDVFGDLYLGAIECGYVLNIVEKLGRYALKRLGQAERMSE